MDLLRIPSNELILANLPYTFSFIQVEMSALAVAEATPRASQKLDQTLIAGTILLRIVASVFCFFCD